MLLLDLAKRGGHDAVPFGTQLRGGPLRQSLVFAQPFNQGGGVSVPHPIDKVVGVFTGSTKPSWNGQVLSFPSGAVTVASLDYGTLMPSTVDLALGAFTVWARVYPKGTVSGGIVERNDANTVNAGWALNMSTTAGNRIGLILERASTNCYKYVAVPTANKWVNVCATYNGTIGAAGLNVYLGGILQTSLQSSDGGGIQGSDAGRNFYVGRGTIPSIVSSGCFDGYVAAIYIWRRLLRQEEMFMLEVDPYAPFRGTALPLIYMPSASISRVQPLYAQRGYTFKIWITGVNTNFVQGVSVVTFSGTGITIESTTVTDARHIELEITVDDAAALGNRTVTVTTGSEVAQLS